MKIIKNLEFKMRITKIMKILNSYDNNANQTQILEIITRITTIMKIFELKTTILKIMNVLEFI